MSINSALSSLSYKGKNPKQQTKQIPQKMLFLRLLSQQGRKEHGGPLSVSRSYAVLQEEEGMMLKRAQLLLKDQGAQLMASTRYSSRRFACLACLYLTICWHSWCFTPAGAERQQSTGWLWSRRQERELFTTQAASQGKLLSPNRDVTVLEDGGIWRLSHQTSQADATLRSAGRVRAGFPALPPSPAAARSPLTRPDESVWDVAKSLGWPSRRWSSRWSRGQTGLQRRVPGGSRAGTCWAGTPGCSSGMMPLQSQHARWQNATPARVLRPTVPLRCTSSLLRLPLPVTGPAVSAATGPSPACNGSVQTCSAGDGLRPPSH